MSELEKLIAQKKEIEEKIKELRGSSINVGCATVRPNPNLSGSWMLAFKKRYSWKVKDYCVRRDVRLSIIESDDRQHVIDMIPEVIKELKQLYKECGGEKDV